MLSVEIDFGACDQYKPLGYMVGCLTRELWLCDLTNLGIGYQRVSDSVILVTERDYTVICLRCLDSDLDITCTHIA